MSLNAKKPFFESLFSAAVKAADPAAIIPGVLPDKPKGRTVVIGAGKGSAQLAQAFERAWDGPLEGVVVTRYGFGAPCENIRIHEASHPVPDAAGLEGSRLLFEAVQGLTEDDLVVALISGGGSALLPCPPDGMTLADEMAVNEALLASGAPISAMNVVRKHLSAIKGGRLAKACHPARLVTLAVSDIPGDHAAYIASGPTVPDGSTRADAMEIVKAYALDLPAAALAHLQTDAADAPKPDDPAFARNLVRVIASAGLSLEAAAEAAREAGIDAVILSDAMEGEAREVAKVHGAMALEIARRDRPFKKPVVLLSGGETTVTLRGKGKGGRNTEFLMSLALTIDGASGISAFAADTDGIDGSEDNAGAFCDASTVSRLRAAGHDARAMLANNDAWTAFDALGEIFAPGPTGTNVNDLRAVLVE
ncbi:MAG: glycerate kinase [Notoacmeibacter sp.]|nr:glycerate kinase [Notoacmeibacter sp.]